MDDMRALIGPSGLSTLVADPSFLFQEETPDQAWRLYALPMILLPRTPMWRSRIDMRFSRAIAVAGHRLILSFTLLDTVT